MDDKDLVRRMLSRLDGMQKAKPSEEFLQRMESLAKGYSRATSKKIKRRSLVGIAASLLLLCMLNAYLVKETSSISYRSSQIETNNYDLLATQFLYDE